MTFTPSILQIYSSAVQARTRLDPHLPPTPLLPSRLQRNLLFKCENFQKTSSFKIRGAINNISLSPPDKKLITASSGNHGIGAACAAKTLGRKLTVVLPETVVPAKMEAIKSNGAEIILQGSETGLAEKYAQRLAGSGEYTYISPYNDVDIVAGQGTIALEMLEQCERVDNIFVAVGGGGLVSGIGAVLKGSRFAEMGTRIYAVAAINSKALAESMALGKVVDVQHQHTIADAVAGGIDVDTITLPLAMAVVDEVLECSEDEIKDALRSLAWDENMIVEGSAALALAGYKKVAAALDGQISVVVLCGANYDQDLVRGILY